MAVDLWDGSDLMLPRDTGRGLYSGPSGMGGGSGRAFAGVGADPIEAPSEDSLDGSCFFIVGLYVAGIVDTPAVTGRLVFSAAATGRGPSLTFGFN